MRETEGFRPPLFILHYSSFIIHYSSFIIHYWVYRPDKPKFERQPHRHIQIKNPPTGTPVGVLLFQGEFYSTRRLYSDTRVSVITNSTPPIIMGQSTTAYWDPSIQTDTQEGSASMRKLWKSLEVKKKWSRW